MCYTPTDKAEQCQRVWAETLLTIWQGLQAILRIEGASYIFQIFMVFFDTGKVKPATWGWRARNTRDLS